MADYIYLLENRLSPAQQRAIGALRAIAREHEATIFLTGGAVRDLTTGGSVRDLDLTIQGDLARVKKSLAPAGFEIVGEHAEAHLLFLTFAGGVRLELGSAVSVTWPKPGKPKYQPGNLTDDLRSRDFTANAMAISLNEGSYGLLMDPLNGVADIENRELRLVSNYGFIEDPSRLVRAVRFMARLGWQLEEKTRNRYDTAKEEGYISNLNPWNRGYELEEVFHEEDPVRILRALENEGWMQHLYPSLSSGKANTASLAELYNRQGELQTQGILSQTAAVAFPLVTGKMAAGEIAALKAIFPRQGFVREIDSLEARVKEFAATFSAKDVAAPSAAWKLLHNTDPNLILATAFSSKSTPVQTRLKTFLTESPTARQRIPYQLLTEMRITPDLPEYNTLLDTLFFELMDNRLTTPEEMKAFLEPFSPPAPPPPPNLRRARARKEAKGGRGKKKVVEVEDTAETETTPLTVAVQEEQAGLASGLTEVGDLTGPNRGPEPTEAKPLDSVAPPPATKSAEPKAKKEAGKQAEAAKAAATPAKKAAPSKVTAVPKTATGVSSKAAPAKIPPAKAVAAKVAPTKPVDAKKTTAKPTAAKKAPLKAAPANAAKKVPPARKTAPVKSVVAKKAPAKLVKPPSRKAPAKKTAPAKKAVAKKLPPKPVKSAAKKVSTTKTAAKKAPAKVAKKAAKKAGRR